MIPSPGQLITIIFRNGYQLQGTVISWSKEQSVLKSITNASTIVIQKTSDDIMLYKLSDAKNDYEALKEKPIKTIEDIKTIAELKTELNEVEREEIREKLREHQPSGESRANNYGSISNFKINSIKQYPQTETRRENTGIGEELSGLFQKRNL